MTEHLAILENAISDVGYWRWWAAELPEVFQVEFAGVQLWNPPTKSDGPPSGQIALQFREPSLVAFLTTKESSKVPADWHTALHEDRIEPFNISHDNFTLRSEEVFLEIVSECRCEYLVGGEEKAQHSDVDQILAFRAGDVGLAVKAKDLKIISSAGILTPEKILESSKAWWTYWKEYWQRRNSDAPFPNDYACEVTIPLRQG